MTFEVTILGSNSAIPAHGRHPTAQVLNHNEKFFLLDCGEGTQMRLSQLKIRRSKIDQIFISHLHGDHYYGLPGLLTSYHLLQRREPLHIFAPKGLKEIIELNFKYSNTRLIYDLQFHEFGCVSPEKIFESEELIVTTLPMNHRIPCCGFLFREKKHSRKILPEMLEVYKIPVSAIADLKRGKDFAIGEKIIPNSELTSDPLPARTYAFCSDTLYNEEFISLIEGADLMYHEATFMNESAQRAVQTFHCTTAQAATIANKAGAGKLLIGHFSAKYTELELMLEEARVIFQNTELALEGEKFSVNSPVLQVFAP